MRKTPILLVTTLSSFLTPYMGSAINIALPAIGKDLDMNTLMLGWVATSYLLSASVFLLPLGNIADRWGRKRLFVAGIVVFTAASFLSAISTDSTMLIVSRLLNGIGGAMTYATSLAILTSSYPKSERGKVLGINVAAVYLGLSLGPTLGGLLTQWLGWHSIFYSCSLLSLVVLPVAIYSIPSDSKKDDSGNFDLAGSVVYGAGIAAVVYGFPKMPGIEGLVWVVAGITSLIFFVRIEKESDNPLLSMEVFRQNPVFVFSNIAAFINYSATYALVFLMSLYLQQISGWSPSKAGMILVAQPVMMTLLSPIAGRLSDKYEPAIVATSGMIITVAGLAMLAFIGASTGIGFIIAVLMLLGTGFALFSSPNTNAVMSSVKPAQLGIASATLGTMRLTGQTMSMGITLLILSLYLGKSSEIRTEGIELLNGIKLTFTVFALLCVAGSFFSMKRGKLRKNDNKSPELN